MKDCVMNDNVMNDNVLEKINLHAHTTFCDGKNTVEEMVLSAINHGFTVFGFSGHSMYPFASDWHIPPKMFESYVNEVRSLEEKYQDRIKILCGFEADYLPPFSFPDINAYRQFNPDYLIGSVHYLVHDEKQFTVDDKTENVKKGLEETINWFSY